MASKRVGYVLWALSRFIRGNVTYDVAIFRYTLLRWKQCSKVFQFSSLFVIRKAKERSDWIRSKYRTPRRNRRCCGIHSSAPLLQKANLFIKSLNVTRNNERMRDKNTAKLNNRASFPNATTNRATKPT